MGRALAKPIGLAVFRDGRRGLVMETRLDDPDASYEAFKNHLTDIDEVANVILKGHLLVENDLDDVIRAFFFHPEYILNDRFRFERKVLIARTMSLNAHKHHHWDLLLALNSLRNEIAHKHAGEERQRRIDGIRRMCLSRITQEELKRHEHDSDRDIVVLACAFCAGFLAYIEDDLKDLRANMDKLAEEARLER
jgi:hypothetical protein